MDFIVAAANLRATVYNIAPCRDREVITRILSVIEPTIPKFKPKGNNLLEKCAVIISFYISTKYYRLISDLIEIICRWCQNCRDRC